MRSFNTTSFRNLQRPLAGKIYPVLRPQPKALHIRQSSTMVKILNVEVGSTGYGLMGFHLPPSPTPFSKAIPLLHHAYTLGSRFWSVAHFYGSSTNNSLHLLHAYFKQYPEHAPHIIISVKIGMDPDTRAIRCDEKGIREAFGACEQILASVKQIDIISCARVDSNIPVEESVSVLKAIVDEGRARGVGVSEVNAGSIRRAAKVTQIVAVEVELSMFTTAVLTNGVAQACKEAGAVIAAYTPLGKGLLTGAISGSGDLKDGDVRRMFPRFAEEALENNLKLVKGVEGVAERIGATKGQVALAWVRGVSGIEGMPEVLPIPGTTKQERLEENMKVVELGEQDRKELDEVIEKNIILGGRYPEQYAVLLEG